jgi:hypothetical protein
MELDPVTLLEDSESFPDSSMELDRHGKLLSKDHDSGPTLHQGLRLGSYPFQKFRETPRKFSGVTERKSRKTGVITYEPWVRFRRDKFYFQGQKTAERAARIRDVAKFWLKINGRHPYNFGEEDYNYLNFVQEFHPQQSDDEIKRLVLEHAQPFLKEVQQSQGVPIVDQPPCVEPARFASKHIIPWSITFSRMKVHFTSNEKFC